MSDAEDHTDELNALDHDAMVSDLVRYMLNASCSKLPVRRADIVTACLRGKARQFTSVYEKAAEVLKKVTNDQRPTTSVVEPNRAIH